MFEHGMRFLLTIAFAALVPLEDIRDALEAYFHLGFNDKKLEEHLKDHYDTTVYGLGCVFYFILFWKPYSIISTVQNKINQALQKGFRALEYTSTEAHFRVHCPCCCRDL